MTTILIGFVGFVFISIAVFHQTSLETFFNLHSLFIVLGGTVCVFALSTPWRQVHHVIRSVFDLYRPELEAGGVTESLMRLSGDRSANVSVTHPLIELAKSLWEQGLDPQMFGILLAQRLDEINQVTEQSVIALRNLAKYPPALGMTGTVVGLVALFAKLSPENQPNLGPSLALAMTSTFYGLALANMMVMPLSDRIQLMHLSKMKTNDHVFRVLLLIDKGEADTVIQEGIHAITA